METDASRCAEHQAKKQLGDRFIVTVEKEWIEYAELGAGEMPEWLKEVAEGSRAADG